MTDVIETTAVEEPGTELAPAQPANLFRGETPAQVLERARETADAFKPVVQAHSVSIQGKAHLQVEGWLTLGAMLGVTPVCVWTHKLDNGWEARVEARTLDGRVIGAAEAECLREEKRWRTADDYAVRSMAQTRATSKALASVLRFVATLAGAAGTPADEMPGPGSGGGRSDSPPASSAAASAESPLLSLTRIFDQAGVSVETRNQYLDYVRTELEPDEVKRLVADLNGEQAQEAYDSFHGRAVHWRDTRTPMPGVDAKGDPAPDDADLPPAA